MMKFTHCFRVNAPQAAVADFHSRSSSLRAITPPPLIMRVHHAPPVLGEGDRMDFTLWAGPLPIHWVAQVEAVSPEGFVDRQVSGPFRQWVHHHTFVSTDSATTDILDEVQASLRVHWLWGPVGLGMWLGLPILFAYRQRRTRRLLESQAKGTSQGHH